MLQRYTTPGGVLLLLCSVSILFQDTTARSIAKPGQSLWDRLTTFHSLSKRDIIASSTLDCGWSCEVGSCGGCTVRRSINVRDKDIVNLLHSREIDGGIGSQVIGTNETIDDSDVGVRSIEKRAFNMPSGRLNAGRAGTYVLNMNKVGAGYDPQFNSDPIGFFNGVNAAAVGSFETFVPGTTINWGTAGLHGCTMLTIVSRRAVYMAHFWETYSTHGDDELSTDGRRQYNERVLQALTLTNVNNPYNPPEANPPNDMDEGERQKKIKNNLYRPPEGDAIDWSFFNAADDNPQAYIMTPLPDNVVNENAGVIKYDKKVGLLESFIGDNIPKLKGKIVRTPYNRLRYSYRTDGTTIDYATPQDKKDHDTTPRGMCLFQYDGAGNWRLFYQAVPRQGTAV